VRRRTLCPFKFPSGGNGRLCSAGTAFFSFFSLGGGGGKGRQEGVRIRVGQGKHMGKNQKERNKRGRKKMLWNQVPCGRGRRTTDQLGKKSVSNGSGVSGVGIGPSADWVGGDWVDNGGITN